MESEQRGATMPKRLTWAAIIVCFVLSIPALLVGAIAAFIYNYFLIGYVGGGTLFSWIGLEIVDEIFLVWFPALLQGLVAGGLAMFGTSKLFKQADYTIVAYSASTLVIALAGLSFYVSAVQGAFFDLDTVGIIGSTAGTVCGYFGVKVSAEEDQATRAYLTTSATDDDDQTR